MIKDSGERSQFSTGAQRDCQAGKGRMDLLPFRALIAVAKVYEEGAKKYNDNNWRKGIPLSRYVDSGTRHLAKWMIGWRDEPHLAQACWNLLWLIETSQMIEEGLLPAELNDLPYHTIEQSENPNNIPPLITADYRAKQQETDRDKVPAVLDNGSPLPTCCKKGGPYSGLEVLKKINSVPNEFTDCTAVYVPPTVELSCCKQGSPHDPTLMKALTEDKTVTLHESKYPKVSDL
jgi:hypothetical protein